MQKLWICCESLSLDGKLSLWLRRQTANTTTLSRRTGEDELWMTGAPSLARLMFRLP